MAVIQMIDDDGVGGHVFTARAAKNISGGMWCVPTSGAWSNDIVASGLVANYDYTDVTITSVQATGTTRPVGIALMDVASGAASEFPIFRQGTVILESNNAITTAGLVAASNAADEQALISDTAAYNDVVGQAYCPAGSEGHAIVRLML